MRDETERLVKGALERKTVTVSRRSNQQRVPRPGASRSLFAPRSKQSRAPPNQCRPRRRLRSVSQQSGSGGANGARDGHVTKVAVAPNEWANTPTQVPSRLWSGASNSLRDAPRAPVGVGEFVSSSM
jgi:hypothetical protein